MTSPTGARLGRRFYPLAGARVVMLLAVLGALACAFASSPVRAASLAFVRVNQVGYATTATKRAYLMASGVETGATFSVKNASGVTVYSAAIGAKPGSWSSSYPDVYALDFGSVTTAGTYTIAVSGPIAGTSLAFPIDTAANVYASSMAHALSFYQNERDGADYIPSALRTAPE